MALNNQELETLCKALISTAIEAGDIIEDCVAKGIKVLRKDDGSPVTAADQMAEEHILGKLEALRTGFAVIGEELVAADKTPDLTQNETYWLVDALDGTKEFINGTGEYTVNIGLIENKMPVMGIVYVPEKKQLYYGYGNTAFKMDVVTGEAKPIATRDMPLEGINVAASRRHGSKEKIESYLSGIKVDAFVKSGSSIKFCLVAEGKADLYPRFGPTCEWDTAAAHAVLKAAGGHVVHASDMTPLSYGKVMDKFYNPEFIAFSAALFKVQQNQL